MLAFALALPVGSSPRPVLTYSGRSENQHFSRTVPLLRTRPLFVFHERCGVFWDIGSRYADLRKLMIAHA